MIGVVIVTHGMLADEFAKAAEHVLGKQEQIATVCILPEDQGEKRRQDIRAAVQSVNTGKGVVILTDMFGGTPSNLAISLMEKNKVEVLAGVNLPVLIKLLAIRKTTPIGEAVLSAQDSGRKYINVASNLLHHKEERA